MPAQSEIQNAVFQFSNLAMLPMLCLRWAQLGAKLPPRGPKLRHFGRDLDFHVRHMASTSI